MLEDPNKQKSRTTIVVKGVEQEIELSKPITYEESIKCIDRGLNDGEGYRTSL